jgi:hypothetical protein
MNSTAIVAQELAINSQTGRSLLAQIKVNAEWVGQTIKDAEPLSMRLHNCPIESLTVEQAYHVLKAQADQREPQAEHDGYCISCGRPSSLRECLSCHEGLTRSELEYRGRKAALRR